MEPPVIDNPVKTSARTAVPKLLTALAVMEIADEERAVINPFAFTVAVSVLDELPKLPGDGLTVASVVASVPLVVTSPDKSPLAKHPAKVPSL
jgi:hypothetical protein